MSKLIYRCMTFAGLIILLMCGKEAQAKKKYTVYYKKREKRVNREHI